MNRTAAATVPLPAPPASPVPLRAGRTTLPSSGVAGVTTLDTARRRRDVGRPTVTASTQTALDFLDIDLAGPSARPTLRLVTGHDTGLERFATRFAQTLVEVIGGDRAVHQLMRWTTDEVYEDLLGRSNALQRVVPGPARTRRLRAQVRSVHVSLPRPEVAELSIHVRHGARSRAIAACIELVESRWRCSALEFG